MNRQFKFRIWDSYKKQFFSNENFSPNDRTIDDGMELQEVCGNVFEHFFNSLNLISTNRNNWDSRFTIQQFTGLFDKNGKEIYEGDILKGKNYFDAGTVKFIGKMIFAKHCDFECRLSNKEGDYTPEFNESFKVIGNIFETPELLK